MTCNISYNLPHNPTVQWFMQILHFFFFLHFDSWVILDLQFTSDPVSCIMHNFFNSFEPLMPIDANVHHTHLAPKLQNLHKSKNKSDFFIHGNKFRHRKKLNFKYDCLRLQKCKNVALYFILIIYFFLNFITNSPFPN